VPVSTIDGYSQLMNLFDQNTEGVFLDVPAEVYHSAPGFSHSMAKAMHPTPAHLQAYLKQKREPTAAMIIGTLVHAKVLEPEKPLPKIVVPPATYPAPADCSAVKQKKAQPGDPLDWHGSATYCKTWVKEQKAAGNIILTQAEFDTVNGCVASIARHPVCKQIFARGKSEISIFRNFNYGGTVLRKSRLDFLPEGNTLADIKTCEDASPKAFAETVFYNRYHSQGAWYLDMINDTDGMEKKECFVIVAVEKKPPYLVAVYNLDPKAIGQGRKLNIDNLAQYINCARDNNWPGYPEAVTELDLPHYAYKKESSIF
jgi:hypothetical protein